MEVSIIMITSSGRDTKVEVRMSGKPMFQFEADPNITGRELVQEAVDFYFNFLESRV